MRRKKRKGEEEEGEEKRREEEEGREEEEEGYIQTVKLLLKARADQGHLSDEDNVYSYCSRYIHRDVLLYIASLALLQPCVYRTNAQVRSHLK